MIDVQGLRKTFKTVTALDGIDFEARDGEITGLIGPNGAGKTTALRILYTVMRPDSGQARIDGFDTVTQRQEVQRRIGVLPDTRGMYPRLTDDFANRRAKGFSKGQTRKVCIARALVHEPQNLLLDEPTNGLDVASSRAVHQLIRDWRDQGRCILFCSHIMQEVAAISDRIVVLSLGRVVAQGTVDELLRQTGETDLENMFLAVTQRAESW